MKLGIRTCLVCEKELASTCEECNGKALTEYAEKVLAREHAKLVRWLIRWSKVEGRLEPAAAAARYFAHEILSNGREAGVLRRRRLVSGQAKRVK